MSIYNNRYREKVIAHYSLIYFQVFFGSITYRIGLNSGQVVGPGLGYPTIFKPSGLNPMWSFGSSRKLQTTTEKEKEKWQMSNYTNLFWCYKKMNWNHPFESCVNVIDKSLFFYSVTFLTKYSIIKMIYA